MKIALLAALFLGLCFAIVLWREYAAQRRLHGMAQKVKAKAAQHMENVTWH